jgi:hypothetical protein
MDGDVKLNESSVVLVHIPYKVPELNKNIPPEESKEESKEEKNVYCAYGKVSKINFLLNGKMRVKVDIGVRSAKDFKTEQELPERELENYLHYAIIEETINIHDAR